MVGKVLTSVREARRLFLEAVEELPRPVETVELLQCPGRVLAVDVRPGADIPAFDRSAKDGYAVIAADTFGASEASPVYLRLAGEVETGKEAAFTLERGSVARIATGGMMPPGADAVVMTELAEQVDARTVEIRRAVSTGTDVVRRGDDFRAGEVVIPRGRLLRPQDIGVLAGIGLTTVEVLSRPRVALLSTGAEVVPPEEEPQPGQIRDMNSYSLAAAVKAAGGTPTLLGITGDDPETIARVAASSLEAADALIISGGSSVGLHDVAPRVIDGLGKPGVVVHGIAVKPGKPTILGAVQGKPVAGLPGNPAACLVAFRLFVLPALRKLMGVKPWVPWEGCVRAVLSHPIASPVGREEYLRVDLRREAEKTWAVPLPGDSGLLTTMVNAAGLVLIPANQPGLDAGDEVDVILFGE